MEEALDIIQRYDPNSLKSIQQHFSGILVFGDERFHAAYWVNTATLCVITERFLTSAQTLAEHVALVLVHENMHARLRAAGIAYKDGRRAPIEVLCAMAELALARRICYREGLAEQVEHRLENWAKSGEAPWSDEAMRQARLEQLRVWGTPKWLVALLDRSSRLILRVRPNQRLKLPGASK